MSRRQSMRRSLTLSVRSLILDDSLNQLEGGPFGQVEETEDVVLEDLPTEEEARRNVIYDYLKAKFRRLTLPRLFQIFALFALLMGAWGIGYSLFGERAAHSSDIVKLALMFLFSKIAGDVVEIVGLPAVLGMLSTGILLKNVGYIDLSPNYLKFAAVLRQCALIDIILAAALAMDPAVLRRMSLLVALLAIVPATVEVLVMMIVSHFLMNLPWEWALLLGLVMGAVSPAVVVPCLFELEKRGYGLDKGIHTLLIAGSVLDDIECIAFFGLVLGTISSTGSVLIKVLEGPIEIGIGIGFGIVVGLGLQFIPHYNDRYVDTLRTLLVGVLSVFAYVGSEAINYSGAGILACFIFAFIAHLRWKRTGWEIQDPVRNNFVLLWNFFEPISFSLIGMEADFKFINADDCIMGTISMLIALLLRMLASAAVTIKSDLNLKETIFVAICWIPKATVQAALGPLAMDYARKVDSKEVTRYARALITVAVMSILITSPIGVILMLKLGPRLLSHGFASGQDF